MKDGQGPASLRLMAAPPGDLDPGANYGYRDNSTIDAFDAFTR
jgi:hypothetical protein